MTPDERRILGNELYAAIYPVLMRYETRGFNAHARAQVILQDVQEKCQQWIDKQKPVESGEENHVP